MTSNLTPGAEPAHLHRKVGLRLIPLLALLFFVAFLDRVNIGFAALTMNRDLGLSPAVYGFGAGIFFVGYMLLEIPSNILLARVGARRWISRIVVSWGVVAALMALVRGPLSFYTVRFFLGVAEAGFFPGVIFYLTLWFPAPQRARMVSFFLMSLPLSNVLGAPVSTLLLGVDWAGLKGWQWLFMLEALPAILLGAVTYAYLPDGPDQARFLDDGEKAYLKQALAAEGRLHDEVRVGDALVDPRVWTLGLIYFGIVTGLYGVGFWLPQIVKAFGGLTNVQVGGLTAIPYAVAILLMFFWGRHSDTTGERVWHVALPAFAGAVGLVCAALAGGHPPLALAGITLCSVGIFSAIPAFWTLPPQVIRGSEQTAGAIALINAIGAIGGFLGGYLTGFLKELTGTHVAGLVVLGALQAAAGLLVLALGHTTPTVGRR